MIIGLYPTSYFLLERKFGLLSSKSPELLANIFWNIGFYTHIILGGLALFIGWIQFSKKVRNKYLVLHRRVGILYINAVFCSSIAGICIAAFATGGIITSLGFMSLGIIWLSTTLMAYLHIRKGHIEKHQCMMVYSYAACFAAVTLRIWLPLLIMIFGDFITAYMIVAWLCWVPNMGVAYLICRGMEKSLLVDKVYV